MSWYSVGGVARVVHLVPFIFGITLDEITDWSHRPHLVLVLLEPLGRGFRRRLPVEVGVCRRNWNKGRLEPRLLEPALLESSAAAVGGGGAGFRVAAELDGDEALGLLLLLAGAREGGRVLDHLLHVPQALLVAVVVAAQVGLVVVHAAVALVAELAEKGPLGLAGRVRLRAGQGLMALFVRI